MTLDDEITEIATVRAPKYGLTPEQVIKEATHYAEHAKISAARAVDWAIDTFTYHKDRAAT